MHASRGTSGGASGEAVEWASNQAGDVGPFERRSSTRSLARCTTMATNVCQVISAAAAPWRDLDDRADASCVMYRADANMHTNHASELALVQWWCWRHTLKEILQVEDIFPEWLL